MFRKGPQVLRDLPRLALAPSRPSRYRLRGDYGWRAKFGGAGGGAGGGGAGGGEGGGVASGGAHLVCTAECAASLLEELAGDAAGGEVVRALLDGFQREYQESHPHLVGALGEDEEAI